LERHRNGVSGKEAAMIVDIYTHIFPAAAYEKMTAMSADLGNIGKRIANMKFLHDLDGRFREMDTYGDYRQIISLRLKT
jgi:aminocarboxymuconate-semialdehyde decarboxylase